MRTEIEWEHVFIWKKERVQQISPVNWFLLWFFWSGRAISRVTGFYRVFLFSRPFIESNLVLWGPKSNGNTYLFEKRKKSPTDFCSSADLLSSRTRSRWVSSRVRRRGRCREPPEGWLALWWLSVRTKMAVAVSGKGGSLCGGSTFFILAAFARPAPAARLLWRRTPALGDLRPRRSSLSLSLSLCLRVRVCVCVCVCVASFPAFESGGKPPSFYPIWPLRGGSLVISNLFFFCFLCSVDGDFLFFSARTAHGCSVSNFFVPSKVWSRSPHFGWVVDEDPAISIENSLHSFWFLEKKE